MAKSVLVWIYLTYLCYFLKSACTGATTKSKACYGNLGLPCTKHSIICSCNKTIAIYDAYYTNNSACTVVGISDCVTDPDSLTEQGYHRFNKTEMMSLYKNCSTATRCVYHAPRRLPDLAFSVVKYHCIDTSEPFNVTCETVERTTIGQRENTTGAIAGGVVATVVAVLFVTLVSVWIIRHRRMNSKEKESLSKDAKPDMTYSLAGKIPQNNYHEIEELRTQNSDYHYATADGMVLPPATNTYFTIEPAGEQTARDNSTASAAVGEYDHIGDKPSQQTSDYDTTASVTQPGNIGEDDYGYNLFQKKVNPQTYQNDYDTAASATQAVAQLSTTERNTDEDDYDHCQRGTNASEIVSSPYDTTLGIDDNPDYSVAGQMK